MAEWLALPMRVQKTVGIVGSLKSMAYETFLLIRVRFFFDAPNELIVAAEPVGGDQFGTIFRDDCEASVIRFPVFGFALGRWW